MDPDLPLILALQQGDDGALDELMRRHRDGVYRAAMRSLNNASDAADVVVETFSKAYFAAGRFKPGASVKAWLYRIALNLCRDRVRWLARRSHWFSLDQPVSRQEDQSGSATWHDRVAAPVPGPAALAERSEAYERLREEVAKLPGRLRDALVLFALEGYSQEECAQILGCSAKSVETRVYRAKKQLAEALGSR